MKWLDEQERAFVQAKLRADVGDNHAHEQITWPHIKREFRDVKMLLASLMYFSKPTQLRGVHPTDCRPGLLVPGYGFAYFAPTIINQYGYSPTHTQLLSVAPWAAAFFASMLVAWASDLANMRFVFLVPTCLVSIAGFATLLRVHDNVPLQYAALFLVVMGQWSALPIVICWLNMNLFGHASRAVGGAWVIGFGNAGGIVSVFLFLGESGPFTVGYSVSIAFMVLAIGLACLYLTLCIVENKGLDTHLGSGPTHGDSGTADEPRRRRNML